VGKGGWINDNKSNLLRSCLLHPLDQLVLGVALEAGQLDTGRHGLRLQVGENLIQRGGTVVLWLPRTQQVQVRTVKDENL